MYTNIYSHNSHSWFFIKDTGLLFLPCLLDTPGWLAPKPSTESLTTMECPAESNQCPRRSKDSMASPAATIPNDNPAQSGRVHGRWKGPNQRGARCLCTWIGCGTWKVYSLFGITTQDINQGGCNAGKTQWKYIFSLSRPNLQLVISLIVLKHMVGGYLMLPAFILWPPSPFVPETKSVPSWELR